MKKVVRIVLALVLLILALLIVTPLLFKGKITQIVRTEANNAVNAQVDFEELSLSLFRSFPDLTVKLGNLSVIGNPPFDQDTLLAVETLSLEVDLASAIGGEKIDINEILISRPYLKARITDSGAANWDIVPQEEEAEVPETEEAGSSSMSIGLQKLTLEHGTIIYQDDSSKMEATLADLNVLLSGDFSESHTLLNLNTQIGGISFTMDNTQFLNKLPLTLSSSIDANLDSLRFTIRENEVNMGGINMNMAGFVAMPDSLINMDITLGTGKTDFKTLLDLLPEAYKKDLAQVKTQGSLQLEAFARGTFKNSESLPEFGARLLVDKASLQYPDLPEKLQNINIDVQVQHPEGTSADATLVDVHKFQVKVGQEPFHSKWHFATPVSDMLIKGSIDGTLDLTRLSQAIPMDSTMQRLAGIIRANISLNGHYSAIEKEDYESFQAKGNVSMANFALKMTDLPQEVQIPQATMNFSPREISLKKTRVVIGKSDFDLDGKISNYLPYVFKDGTLRGILNHHSNFINTNEFLADTNASPSGETTTTPSEGDTLAVAIPRNIYFTFNSKVDRILYDKLDIRNTNGRIEIKDGIAYLSNLKMNLLDGSVTLNGQYNTQETFHPKVNFKVKVNSVNVSQTAASFSSIGKLAPLAYNTQGMISSDMDYHCRLNPDLSVDLNSLKSEGLLSSDGLKVTNQAFLNQLAAQLKNPKYKTLETGKLRIHYIVKDGNMTIKPFKTTVYGKTIDVSGNHSLTGNMDYRLRMPVSRKELGRELNDLLKLVSTSNSDLPVTVLIKGNMKKPEVKVDLSEARKQLQKEVSKNPGKALENVFKKFF